MLARVKKTGEIVDVYPIEEVNGYYRSDHKWGVYNSRRRFNHNSIVLEGNLEQKLAYQKLEELYDKAETLNAQALLLAALYIRDGEIQEAGIDYAIEITNKLKEKRNNG